MGALDLALWIQLSCQKKIGAMVKVRFGAVCWVHGPSQPGLHLFLKEIPLRKKYLEMIRNCHNNGHFSPWYLKTICKAK